MAKNYSKLSKVKKQHLIRRYYWAIIFRMCVAILSPKALPVKLNMTLSKHQYLPSCISSAHHSPDPLLPWPMKEYQPASLPALPSQINDCPFHYPFPLFTKLLHVPAVFFV